MTPFRKIALALAATGVPIRELERLFLNADHAIRLDLLSLVEALRNDVEHFRPAQVEDAYQATRYEAGDMEPALMIERLLRHEAGLSAADSVRLLSMAVQKRHPKKAVQIPPYTKNSFLDWVSRLCRVIPSSEVMHLAARIRNDLVHSTEGLPWELRSNRIDG